MKSAAEIAANAVARAVITSTQAREPHDAYPRIYLRCVDAGTNSECWVVCNRVDHGAVPFVRED